MDFDQVIFQRIYNFLAKKKKKDLSASPYQVQLTDIRARLLILARAISGDPVDLLSSEREGGWKDESLYLPAQCDLYDSLTLNANFYLFRIFYLATQRNMALNWSSREQHDTVVSQAKAAETSSLVIEKVMEEYPLLAPILDELKQGLEDQVSAENPDPDYTWLYGRWMRNSAAYENKKDLQNVSDHTFGVNSVTAETEIKAKQAE